MRGWQAVLVAAFLLLGLIGAPIFGATGGYIADTRGEWNSDVRLEGIVAELRLAGAATGDYLLTGQDAAAAYSEQIDAAIKDCSENLWQVTWWPYRDAPSITTESIAYIRALQDAIAAKGDTDATAKYGAALDKLDDTVTTYKLDSLDKDLSLETAPVDSGDLKTMAFLGGLLAALCVAASVAAARRTHRALNVGLLIATLAAAGIVAGCGLVAAGNAVAGQFSNQQAAIGLGQNRMALAQAQTIDLRAVLERQWDDQANQRWDDLVDSTWAKLATDSVVVGHIAKLRTEHQALVKLMAAGDWDKAAADATSSGDDAMPAHWSSLQTVLSDRASDLDSDIDSQFAAFANSRDILTGALLPLCLLGAAASVLGLQQRIKEYR
jgi:hypothetical protein